MTKTISKTKSIHNVDLVSMGRNPHGVSSGCSIKVMHLVTNQDKVGQYHSSAPNKETLCQ